MEQCSGPFDRFGFLGLTSVLIIGCSLGAKADIRYSQELADGFSDRSGVLKARKAFHRPYSGR